MARAVGGPPAIPNSCARLRKWAGGPNARILIDALRHCTCVQCQLTSTS